MENGASCSQQPTGSGAVRRPPSVRYISDPSRHAANRNRKTGAARHRAQSEMSDYNDGLDQIVLTDMTTVPALDDTTDGAGGAIGQDPESQGAEEEESTRKYERSISTMQVKK